MLWFDIFEQEPPHTRVDPQQKPAVICPDTEQLTQLLETRELSNTSCRWVERYTTHPNRTVLFISNKRAYLAVQVSVTKTQQVGPFGYELVEWGVGFYWLDSPTKDA